MRQVEDKEVSSPSSESNFVLDYKEKTGRPYIADWLDARFLYDQGTSKDDMDTLDEWITFEIKRQNFKYTKESYAEIFNTLRKKIGLSKNLSPVEQVSKMTALIHKALEQNKIFNKMGIKLSSLEELYGNLVTT